jgi:transposase InsO family protein
MVTMDKAKQHRYTAEERDSILRRAEEIGVRAAADEMKVPQGTIASWRFYRRQRATTSESVPNETEQAVEPESLDQKPALATETIASACLAEQAAELGAASPSTLKKKVAKRYTPSQRAEILEYAAKAGPTEAERKFGTTRFSIYSWQRQAERHAQGKATSSPVTGSDEDTAAIRDQRILKEWRSHPGLGPSQVRNQLRRQGMKVSMHTVRCVLEDNGYVSPKVRRVEAHDQRYEAVRPNHLWHLDFLHRHIHKQKVYLLLVLDDYSRFIVGGALWDGERVAAVMETFNDAVQRHGKPEKVMSDGGSAFYAWKGVGQFTKLLEEYEIDQIVAKTPQNNGKCEVLNANVSKELFNQETFFDLGEAGRRLAAWIRFYNFRRTHHALGGLLVPADRYFGRADEVLAKIESGGNPDGVDEPAPVGERQLDIFRVTSHRGQVELHLLGHRIPLPIVTTAR